MIIGYGANISPCGISATKSKYSVSSSVEPTRKLLQYSFCICWDHFGIYCAWLQILWKVGMCRGIKFLGKGNLVADSYSRLKLAKGCCWKRIAFRFKRCNYMWQKGCYNIIPKCYYPEATEQKLSDQYTSEKVKEIYYFIIFHTVLFFGEQM